MLNKVLQEVIAKIKKEYPRFGYIRVTLLFNEDSFIASEFEISEATVLKKVDSKDVE